MDDDAPLRKAIEEEEIPNFEQSVLPPVDISNLEERAKAGTIDEVAFELFKETASVLVCCASTYIAHSPQAEISYPRNQAICIGLLVRLVKFMRGILAILSHGHDLREVNLALLRCLAETSVSVRYLILKNDEATFDEFVRTGLGPDAALYDFIQINISQRNGEALPFENRMLRSIERVFRVSRVSVDDIQRKHTEWGGGLKNRLKELGIEEMYVIVQRIPSHAVHGTWGDLMLHHLEEKGDGFSPLFEDWSVDARLLLPICRYVLLAAQDYVEHYFADASPLISRITDLQSRIVTVSDAHEDWYESRRARRPSPEE